MYSVVMQIKIDQVKEDNTVSLEEKLELLEEIMDYEDSLGVDMVLSDLEEMGFFVYVSSCCESQRVIWRKFNE